MASHESNISDDAGHSSEGEEGWEDAEADEESLPVTSFFSDEVFPDAKSMIEDCRKRYQFDFLDVCKQFDLEFYGAIKLVNYIRSEAKNGRIPPKISSTEAFQDDRYLQPVLEDDALLVGLDELLDDQDAERADFGAAGAAPRAATANGDTFTRVAELEEQLQRIQAEFADYRSMVQKTLDERWADADAGPGASKSKGNLKDGVSRKQREEDAGYFQSYSYNEIHETMLKDTVRTDAYRDFIYGNKDLFSHKVVLDVGCGTGILSMFCARAGAAKVIAVDNSDIIDKARVNIHANGLDDKITCLRGKIEEVNLPIDKVDVIVSEWMGYCLLFEAMLDSVLWARDRYLVPDGLMVPSHCVLHIAPFSDDDFVMDNVDFWRGIYGFDMSAMLDGLHKDVQVRQFTPPVLAARSDPFLTLPLHTISAKDLTFATQFCVQLKEDIKCLDGWVIWFDTFFLPSASTPLPESARAEQWKDASGRTVAFTTGPYGTETHWKSGLLLIERNDKPGIPLTKGNNIAGHVAYSKGEEGNSRGLEIKVDWQSSTDNEKGEQLWTLR